MLPVASPAALVAFGPQRSWTRADLDADVASLADLPAGRWLVLCRGRYWFAVAMLAAARGGAVVVLPSHHAPDALAAVVATVDLVLVDEDAPWPGAVRVDGRPRAARVDITEPPAEAPLAWLATSGSTGEPRWHVKTAGQLLGEARALVRAFDLGPSDRVVSTAPPHHIYGLLFSVWVPLLSGAAFADDTPLFPEAVAARVADATVLVSVPAHLRALVGLPLERLRRVFSSGAPLDPVTAAALRLPATEVFGSTETGGIAWRRQVDDMRWTPLPGVEVREVDGRMEVASPWTDGGGRWLSDDAVRVEGDRFVHLGRRDDVVKVASKRVSLGAVEAALLAVDGVVDAAVLLVEVPGRAPALHAAYVGPAVEEVRAAIARRLEGVAVPRLHRVDALPRQANGKLPRSALRALVLGAPDEVVVPAEHAGFAGHFPGFPVLPGVLGLRDLVLPAIRARWPDLGRLARIDVVTWHRPILPGDRVAVAVEREDGRVRFRLTGAVGACASGTLRFAEGATGAG